VYKVAAVNFLDYFLDITALSEIEAQAFRVYVYVTNNILFDFQRHFKTSNRYQRLLTNCPETNPSQHQQSHVLSNQTVQTAMIKGKVKGDT
jgi:hypothetical protein